MEEVMDFDQFIANYIPQKVEYEAIYNEDGIVIKVCPKGTSDAAEKKVPIDIEIVEQINEGKLQLHNCFVDIESGEIEIIKKQYLKKIDDLFHRIPDIEYSPKMIPDIELVYDSAKNLILFSMMENLRTKKIRWSGDTVLVFYFTGYNDPHTVFKKVEFTIDELYKDDLSFQLNTEKKFSVFTRRIFKNYRIKNIK